MDKNRFAAILVVFLLFAMPASGPSQTVEDMKKEMNTIHSEIAQLDRLIQLLRGHETRWRAVVDNP